MAKQPDQPSMVTPLIVVVTAQLLGPGTPKDFVAGTWRGAKIFSYYP